jgi:UDP-glucose-4-epimerase GalE
MRALVTGGAGYIGSHACQRLLADGHHVVSLDNLFRGHQAPMRLLGERFPGRLVFVRGECGDAGLVASLIVQHGLDTVLHFGALAYVGESVTDPLGYYRANVASGVGLLEGIDRAGAAITRMVFSSSCATYGDPPEGMVPVPEHCPQRPTSPYGRTKLMFEHMLLDYAAARRGRPFAACMLRYFNVAGADASGMLGEDHTPETHLVPVALQCALGRREGMSVFGTDYPTPDGTCVRDYVHVEDLIDAHVRALDHLDPASARVDAYNVGIGRGYSVREVIAAAERVTGVPIRVTHGPRRAGDAVALYNDPSKIARELGWQARHTDLDGIVRTAWDWTRRHPDGYPRA